MPYLRETKLDDGMKMDFPDVPLLVTENDESATASVTGAGKTLICRLFAVVKLVMTKFVALLATVARLAKRMMSPMRNPAVTGLPPVTVNDELALSAVMLEIG